MYRAMFGVLVLAAVVLAGCNSNSGSNPPTGTCGPPVGTTVALVYPAPNSTGIPDNFGVVVLGSTAALPGGYDVYVVNNTTQNSVYFNTVGVPPSPLPSPYATPAFANPVYQSSGNPGTTFVAGSTITVYLNNANNQNCIPTTSLGSFTVQ